MEVLLLVGAIVILGVWVGWHEYRLNKLQEASQHLVDAVKYIDGDLTGRRYCYYANLITASQLKAYDSSLEFTINNLAYDIGKLKEADNDKKELEMIADRKDKMADYLMIHPSDSINDLAAALYDIASGKTEEEEQ